MLEKEEIRNKLFEQGELFKLLMKNKQYAAAKHCYQATLNTATLVELDQPDVDKLFGIRGEKGVILKEGCFPEGLVIRMMEMADVRGYGDNGKQTKTQ